MQARDRLVYRVESTSGSDRLAPDIRDRRPYTRRICAPAEAKWLVTEAESS